MTDKKIISRSIDGMITEIRVREKHLYGMWRRYHLQQPRLYKGRTREFRLFAKAVSLIREIKKLRIIVAEMNYILVKEL